MARKLRRKDEEPADPMFIGSTFSNQELRFLLEHLGEPSELAYADIEDEFPEGVNPAAVTPILDRTYRLHLLEQAARERYPDTPAKVWVGFEALRQVCQDTLDWNATVVELKARTRGSNPVLRRAAAAPSLFLWDPDTDIPYLGGVGSDSDIVMTALDGSGRKALFTELRESGVGGVKSLAGIASFIKSKSAAEQQGRTLATTPTALLFEKDGDHGAVKCPLCGFAAPYELSKPSSKKAAMHIMDSHLSDAKTKKEQHRILKNRLGSGRVGRARPVVEPEPEEIEETEE